MLGNNYNEIFGKLTGQPLEQSLFGRTETLLKMVSITNVSLQIIKKFPKTFELLHSRTHPRLNLSYVGSYRNLSNEKQRQTDLLFFSSLRNNDISLFRNKIKDIYCIPYLCILDRYTLLTLVT